MAKTAAGLILHEGAGAALRALLVHPGGPFFAGKEAHAWGIPKGEPDPGEDLLACARREFWEETGHEPPPLPGPGEPDPYLPLGTVTQPNGKVVHAWAFAGVWVPARFRSNTCVIEWPPRSGQPLEIPENDRAELFALPEARQKIREAQWPLLERLAAALAPYR